jgi:hypothetical protein
MAAAAVVQARVAEHLQIGSTQRMAEAEQELSAATAALPARGALENLVEWFGLSPFERDVVMLCASVELDGGMAQLLAKLPQLGGVPRVTFSLALAALPGAHWNALSPQSPLRDWRLVVRESDSVVHGPLRIDERVLHFLTGTPALDRNLTEILYRICLESSLPGSHQQIAAELALSWSEAGDNWPILQLCGPDGSAHRAIAATVCQHLGLALHGVDAHDIPHTPGDRHAWFKCWEREAILSDSALLIEGFDNNPAEILRALQRSHGALIVSSRDPLPLAPRSSLRTDVPSPTRDEQRTLWTTFLGEAAGGCNGQIDAVISQFDLPLASMAATARCARAAWRMGSSRSPEKSPPPLWHLCRAQVSTRLGDLAQRIEPCATWSDLILPPAETATLHTIVAQVRQRAKVYDDWGFAGKSSRGLGLSTLFAGVSGTGKTMAGEVLAGALELDLYRIDLSAVVSKYIGETEKNLRQVFDAAEAGGAVLLFDEADALFGRRSEVKDSHDRYANIEVSYLLQRMEAYRGLAILTTNLKEALDAAFVRRLRFIVQFPFPDAAQRVEIWRRTFPTSMPTQGLDLDKLSRLNVTGGSIRNIALNAAFLAAEEGEPLKMRHLRAAAETEAIKFERPLMETEVKGWI